MVGLETHWLGGSKSPAIATLLRNTLEHSRGKFCQLVLFIVKTAIPYRSGKNNPIKREEILAVNRIVAEIGFKIPELWKAEFLKSLTPSQPDPIKVIISNEVKIQLLKNEFIKISALEPQTRGYVFQKFLSTLFELADLNPKSAFRITGEEIDGSFEVNGHTYLLEAKWQNKVTSQSDILVFSGKVSGKATWSRGLFVSYGGFSKDGLEAFARGKQTNVIGMDAQDLFFILDGKMNLSEAITLKARHASETNNFFVSVYELANK